MADIYAPNQRTGTVAFAGQEKPWKANGAEVDPNASLDTWVKEAGLDYEVTATPSLYNWNGTLREVPNRVQLIRSDTGASLSEVSANSYKIRQPREMVEFFRQLITTSGMQMQVIGQMQGGRKMFALARTGEEAEIIKGSGDILAASVFFIDSFDGSHATKVREGVERFFCLNQLENPFSSFANKGAVKRKHSQHFDGNEVLLELGQVNANFLEFVERAKAMAKVKMTHDMVERFLTRLYAPDAFGEHLENWRKAKYDLEPITTNKKNVIADVFDAVEDNLGYALTSAAGNLYGVLNAVSFYHDHDARSKGNKRWESAMIGAGNRCKNEALTLALEVIEK